MSFYSEFKGLEEITVDGTTYVNKKQLLRLIGDEQKRYREGTESGYLNLKKKQTMAVDLALNHLKVLLCKRFYDQLRQDMFKFLIAGIAHDIGSTLYFKGWCDRVPGSDGKQTPTFTMDPNLAERFETREEATETIRRIHEDWPKQDIAPVQVFWTQNRVGLERMHAFIGWPENKVPEDVLEDEIQYRRKPE